MERLPKSAPLPRAATNGCIAPIFGLFLFAGLFLAGLALYGGVRSTLARWTWVPTSATVLDSSVSHKAGSDGDAGYALNARYRYLFRGKTYVCDSVGVPGTAMMSQTPSEDAAYGWMAEHRNGSLTTVRVNPAHPVEAAMETELTLVNTIAFFFAIPFIAVGAAAMSGFLSKRQAPLRKGIVGYVAIAWGVLALLLHITAGSVSPLAWLAFTGYFYIVGRLMWETFRPKANYRR